MRILLWKLPIAFLMLGTVSLGMPPNAKSAGTAYGFTFIPRSDVHRTPRIRSIELSSNRLTAGGPIAIRITTTPDVVAVETGNGPLKGSVPRTARGRFETQSTLPHLRGYTRIKIKLHFKATTAAGMSTTEDVPVTYR